ncbi:MAG: ATP-dependent RecD-like DNA helicase [Ruminococcaceae bacterium]|nr:ATP-dependent RecD-like DNA helicase [Oscillospiraceae bacterium]
MNSISQKVVNKVEINEETITGVVEEITFQNEQNGFTVLDFSADDELFTAVGVMPGITAGETVSLTGNFVMHPTFGRQLKVTAFTRTLPETSEQIIKYLSSGVIRGIGPKKALLIVETFGTDTLNVIEETPERLSELKGISLEQAKNIGEEFKRQYAMRTVMLGLEKYGLTPNECVRIYKKLGIGSVEMVKENPYCLCSLGIGISFDKAEVIESKLEEKPVPEHRIKEGILHVMRHNRNSRGHTCIPREKLLKPCADLLSTNEDTIDITIDSLVSVAQLKTYVIDGTEFVFLPSSYRDEKRIAERMSIVAKFPPPRMSTLAKTIDDIEYENDIKYEELQRMAIATAANKGLLILTGGPGTGKTTAIKGIIKVFEKQQLDIALAAPTGRAAKRMTELTGREAKTIHRLLEVEWDEDDRPVFRRDTKNPLECNALILDELSMVDISLFASLLDALPLGCRLILVGDSDQLPPVGAGNVLHDLIKAEVLPVIELNKVFRQAMESKIVSNAHKIVHGEMPDLKNDNKDFFHMERQSTFLASETVAELCAVRLKKAYNWDPLSDIQVICPSKKGETGTVNLNKILQNVLNPKDDNKHEVIVAGQLFREGDKVMQTKNNYNIEWESEDEKGNGIFNGDIGILEKINTQNGLVTLNFDGRVAEIAAENLSELDLSYAITVHKSQGSEFKAVIMPVIGVVPELSYRNLLYTAVTRAKDMLITVGSSDLVFRMTANDKKSKRYSALSHFLKAEF